MLNECTVIISKCRHRNICALESYDSMDSNVKCKVGIFAIEHNDKKFIYSKKFQEQAFFYVTDVACVVSRGYTSQEYRRFFHT